MERSSFGYWLRLKRKALDFTRDQLAERIGYSAATVRKIEDEERRPSAHMVEQLADIFNIPLAERESFLRFARGDWKSAPGELSQNPPWRAPAKSPPPSIPATSTSLIGRANDIALVCEYLSRAEVRLVTLMGPPGIGKTRLSIESARALLPEFPEGVFFVGLALLDNAVSIAPAILAALGYMESGSRAPADQLQESIGSKKILIVLDNCEHLVEETAAIASGLLSACPQLKMLATSRESFRISGEWLYPVPALDIPKGQESIDVDSALDFPALRLFIERAHAVRPDLRLTPRNIQTIAAICRHLDGLPLAIELIAARTRLLSPQALLERLGGGFALAVDGMRAAPERQRTLRNAIDWSYNLLSAEEQQVFAYLSVFAGSFTLEDAEAMLARSFTGRSVPELLVLLLDKSLIQRAAGESSQDHYEMLVTIQEYAHELLQRLGDEIQIRSWHLSHFLQLAQEADHELYGPNQLEWLSRLGTKRDNLRAALNWAIETRQTQPAAQLALRLDWFWFIRSDHAEAAQWLLRILELPDVALYPEAHAEALSQLAHHIHLLGDRFAERAGGRGVEELATQALSIARAHNDAQNSARALSMIALHLITRGTFEEARSMLDESRRLFQQVRDEHGDAFSLFLLGWSSFVQNDLASAVPMLEQVRSTNERRGERYFMCVALRFLGTAYLRLGQIRRGVEQLRESLTIAQELGSKYEIGAAFYRWGQAAQYLGSPARTVSLFCAAKKAHDSVGLGVWTQGLDSEFESVLERCRAVLGEAAFAQAVDLGRAMTMEQAIEYALEAADG